MIRAGDTLTGASVEVGDALARKRRKVDHLMWLEEGEIAEELGVDVRHLCGTWGPPPTWEGSPWFMETVGDLMAVPLVEDCKRCVRVLESNLRRAGGA